MDLESTRNRSKLDAVIRSALQFIDKETEIEFDEATDPEYDNQYFGVDIVQSLGTTFEVEELERLKEHMIKDIRGFGELAMPHITIEKKTNPPYTVIGIGVWHDMVLE